MGSATGTDALLSECVARGDDVEPALISDMIRGLLEEDSLAGSLLEASNRAKGPDKEAMCQYINRLAFIKSEIDKGKGDRGYDRTRGSLNTVIQKVLAEKEAAKQVAAGRKQGGSKPKSSLGLAHLSASTLAGLGFDEIMALAKTKYSSGGATIAESLKKSEVTQTSDDVEVEDDIATAIAESLKPKVPTARDVERMSDEELAKLGEEELSKLLAHSEGAAPAARGAGGKQGRKKKGKKKDSYSPDSSAFGATDTKDWVALLAKYRSMDPLHHIRPRAEPVLRPGYLGIRNLAATCYLETNIQMLGQIPIVVQTVLDGEVPGNAIVRAFRNLMVQQWRDPSNEGDFPLDPTELLTAIRQGPGGRDYTTYRQQDAQESFAILVDQLKEVYPALRGIFDIRTQSMMSCPHCGARVAPQREIQLAVSIPQGREEALTVQDCIEATLGLSEHGGYTCTSEVCLAERPLVADRQVAARAVPTQVLHAPPILTVHLKRFRYLDEERSIKLHTPITVSEHIALPVDAGEIRYRLIGVTYHAGPTLQSGHYTTTVLNHRTGEWLNADDDFVTVMNPIGEETFSRRYGDRIEPPYGSPSTEAYLLLYEQIDA